MQSTVPFMPDGCRMCKTARGLPTWKACSCVNIQRPTRQDGAASSCATQEGKLTRAWSGMLHYPADHPVLSGSLGLASRALSGLLLSELGRCLAALKSQARLHQPLAALSTQPASQPEEPALKPSRSDKAGLSYEHRRSNLKQVLFFPVIL